MLERFWNHFNNCKMREKFVVDVGYQHVLTLDSDHLKEWWLLLNFPKFQVACQPKAMTNVSIRNWSYQTAEFKALGQSTSNVEFFFLVVNSSNVD